MFEAALTVPGRSQDYYQSLETIVLECAVPIIVWASEISDTDRVLDFYVLLSNAGNVVSIEDCFHAVWKDEYHSKQQQQ